LLFSVVTTIAMISSLGLGWSASPNGVKTLDPPGAIKAEETWSLGARAGDFIFVAGMQGIDPATNSLVQDPQARIVRAFLNLKLIAQSEGASLQDCVRLTVYVSDLPRFAPMVEKAQTELWGGPPYPPRTMVEVKRLFDDDIVEIDSVFYAPLNLATSRIFDIDLDHLHESEFAQWQVRWQTAVLGAKGALSVEFWPPAPPDQLESVAIARFASADALRDWRRSDRNRQLIDGLAKLADGAVVMQLVGQASVEYAVQHGVTLVITTEVRPGKEEAYRAWAARIQKLQAKFPGYVGSFVQPPQPGETGWSTVLRFDSAANLERWMKSDERTAMIKRSEALIAGFHAQRVDTSFPGWVPADPTTGKPPNMWKTAALVLLTLFPVVMLELRFLNPHLETLNPALRTFIGNALSVALTTWPLMPLAIWGFHAWLFPEHRPRWLVQTMPLVLVLCYLMEIVVLWHLL
jgi:antibiotic biosynthesis monooxygenase (ABM) superfamily enzyme/enamine deaminase RidA (YjgF/YER057c/UK114 family)